MDRQVKEKLRIALIFALNAGFMDGFSFFHFNDRFIGAQSGNVIQAGINIAKGDFARFWDFANCKIPKPQQNPPLAILIPA